MSWRWHRPLDVRATMSTHCTGGQPDQMKSTLRGLLQRGERLLERGLGLGLVNRDLLRLDLERCLLLGSR